jgi:heat shock protein HslJ
MKIILLPIFALNIFGFVSANTFLSSHSHSHSDFVYDTTLISKKLLKKWQLVELNGQPISALGKPAKTPYIQFDSTRRVAGNNGCNQFFGSYELEKKGRIKFSAMGSTRMACVDNNTIESDLMQVLSNTDSYVIVNDTLVFNRARMAPLARWVKMKSGKTKNK